MNNILRHLSNHSDTFLITFLIISVLGLALVGLNQMSNVYPIKTTIFMFLVGLVTVFIQLKQN